MKNMKFKTARRIDSWTWLMLDSANAQRHWPDGKSAFEFSIETWARELNNVGIQMGLRPTTQGKMVEFETKQNTWQKKLEDAIKDLSRQKLDFVLVILPVHDTALYNAVKISCDIKYGVRHACVVAEKFKKDNVQYNANVALKVNLKLGGTNQFLDKRQLGLIDEGKTMLVGIDVTHPSPGSVDTAPSIAAMVASIGPDLAQFPAKLSIQEAKQEKVDSLQSLLTSRLGLWKKHNNQTYPENILVYRDGVSEGQYEMVANYELSQLKAACKAMYPAQDQKKGLPRISIVVVGKRHNTRFYVTQEKDAEQKSKNPHNGLVVDRGVTEARTFDFFLQSHKALQGTARPGHYITVYDEIFCRQSIKPPMKNAADVLQDLSHRLCYTFGRATKAVSICPPAYYADLACDRARCYLSEVFDPQENETKDSNSRQEYSKNVTIHEAVKDTMFYI